MPPVNVALPALGEDLDASVSGLQWTINAYTLALASLILLGGSLADRFGRRRVFQFGVVWFTVASLLCGLAPNIETLIGARVLQGVGGALLTPGSLAILQASFAPDDRARAVGAWSGLSGIAAAAGPLIGGWLIDTLSWRSVLPVTILMLTLSARAGALAERIGPRRPMTVGPLVMAGGLLLLLRVDAGAAYLTAVLPAVAVFGLGLSATVAPLTATVMAAVDQSHTGLASGINNAVSRGAGLLAVAMLPALAGLTGDAYLDPELFAAGFRTAMAISAGLVATGGVLAWVLVSDQIGGDQPACPESQTDRRYHCAVDGAPFERVESSRST